MRDEECGEDRGEWVEDRGADDQGGSIGDNCLGHLLCRLLIRPLLAQALVVLGPLLGPLLFPAMLYLLGWNEHNYVCENKRILFAEANVKPVGCDANGVSGFSWFGCSVDPSSFTRFSVMDLNQGVLTDNVSIPISFVGAEASQHLWMYQCIETKTTTEEKKDDKKRSVTTYSYRMDWSSNLESITPEKVPYAKTICADLAVAGQNPPFPVNVASGKSSKSAASVQAGTHGNSYTIPNSIFSGSLGASPVSLAPFRASFVGALVVSELKTIAAVGLVTPPLATVTLVPPGVPPPPAYVAPTLPSYVTPVTPAPYVAPVVPSSVTVTLALVAPPPASVRLLAGTPVVQLFPPWTASQFAPTMVNTTNLQVAADGNALETCSSSMPRLGCVMLSYQVSKDAIMFSVIADITAGQLSPKETPSSWSCSGSTFGESREGNIAKDKMLAQLASANSTATWNLRIIGILGAWLAVYCIFPSAAAVPRASRRTRPGASASPASEGLQAAIATSHWE
mmetsp:Transcript_145329/g.465632  ORF Transcript_145329/g.465632 Transcript_145329/m.465632 type:complete len:509 (-) Transcript_145329:115-1641(-)